MYTRGTFPIHSLQGQSWASGAGGRVWEVVCEASYLLFLGWPRGRREPVVLILGVEKKEIRPASCIKSLASV